MFLFTCIEKAGLSCDIQNFFNSYYAGRSTTYTWNGFSLPPFNTSIGVGQGSVLSPIISAIYITPIIRTFKNRVNNLGKKIPLDILSFVDDRLLVFQEKSYKLSSAYLLCSYNIMFKLLLDMVLRRN